MTTNEQKAVKDAVKKANQDLKDEQITVDRNGKVTIIRGDKKANLDPSLTVIGETPDTDAPAAPNVEAKDDGSVTVTPPADKDTKTVDVTYIPEGKDETVIVVATKGEGGKWTLPEGSDLTIDTATGIVTIPADKVKDNTEVTAIAKDNAGNRSKEGIATAGKNPVVEKTDAPKINKPKAGDKEIKGTSEPNAKVEVELPDGTKVETKADGEGNWTAKVPEGKEPKAGKTVKATATVDGKKPSEEATVAVKAWKDFFTAEGGELVVRKGKGVTAHDVYNKVKLIYNDQTFGVDDKNNISLPIGNKSNAWLYVDSSKLPTKDSSAGQYTENVTITYPDGSKQIVKVIVKVVEGQTDAEKNPAVDPAKTEVKDKTALTKEEKAKVAEEVKKANPEAKDVTVGDDGKATLTYKDDSTNEIPGDKTVTQKQKPTPGGTTPTPRPGRTTEESPKRTTDRTKGKDRVETAIEISKKYFGKANTVIVVDKKDFPDAMTASVLSKLLKAPILLTDTNCNVL